MRRNARLRKMLAAALIAAAGVAGFVTGVAWTAGQLENDEPSYSARNER